MDSTFLLQFQEFINPDNDTQPTEELRMGTQTCTRSKEENDQDAGTSDYQLFCGTITLLEGRGQEDRDFYERNNFMLGTSTHTATREEPDQDATNRNYSFFS